MASKNLTFPSTNNAILGVGKNLILPAVKYTRRMTGRASIYMTVEGSGQVGSFNLFGGFDRVHTGLHRIRWARYSTARGGRFSVKMYVAFVRQTGQFRIFNQCAASRTGQHRIYERYDPIRRTGRFNVFEALTAGHKGRCRVSNNAAEGYAVYVGYDGPPDFSQDPDGFGTSLPVSFSVTTPPSGTTDLYVVLRKVNRYGLESQNQYAQVITIDSNGDEALGPISAPEILDAVTGVDDEFNVYIAYRGIDTDANPADTWRLYVKKDTPPVPGTDTPVATGSASAQGAAIVGPYTEGDATYHIAATVYRTADSLESSAATTSIVLGADPLTPVGLVGGFAV